MIGIVVIGRNEGERLRRCLASLALDESPRVYVDSGSTDDSVALATGMGWTVLHLDPAEGFTAAKARNMGIFHLAEGPAPEFVQVVDGDCEVAPDWLSAAATALREDPGLAVVAGRRRERYPDATIFNRQCDMEWDTPVGESRTIGGDALYRAAALAEVGGFDASFICGEEPELCYRLRQAGWRVRRLDHEMTLHDAAMTRWSQWWKRAMRTGWAFAEGAATYGAGPEAYNVKQHRSDMIWGLFAPGLALACLALWAMGLGFALWGALAILAAYPAMALRVARYRMRARGDALRPALIYGGLVMLGKIPSAFGALKYLRIRNAGAQARIIEYKDA